MAVSVRHRRFSAALAFAAALLGPAAHAGDADPAAHADAFTTDPIVVTGSRTEHRQADAPVATEVIDRDTIEASGAEDLAALLATHPGVDLDHSVGGTGVRLHGLEARHVLVLVDGERIGGRVDGVIDLARLSLDDVQRVEIVKGPSSALYGSDAMGGVIHVITRRTRAPVEAELRAVAGTPGRLDASARLGWRGEGLRARLSGGWRHVPAFRLDSGSPATTGSAADVLDLAARLEFDQSASTTWTASTTYQRRDLTGVDRSATGAVFDRRNLIETLAAQLGHDTRSSTGTRLRVSAAYHLYRDQFLNDQRGSDALDQAEETVDHWTQLSAQVDHALADRHFVTAGLEGGFEQLSTERLADAVGDRAQLALYAQDEWAAVGDPNDPTLLVAVGARADLDSRYGFHPTPKVNLRWRPHDQVTVRAGYGWGFRAPDFKELLLRFENPGVGYGVYGNPDLRPERSAAVDAQVEVRPSRHLRVTVSGFRSDVDDLIAIASIERIGAGALDRYAYVNVASAVTQGLEANVRVDLSFGLSVDAGYALTDTEDLSTGRPLEGRALHRGTLDVGWRLVDAGFDARARGALVGERPFYSDDDADGVEETTWAAPYLLLGARVSQRLGDHLSLFAGADNLLDAGDPTTLPIHPRTFYLGVTGRL